MRRSNRLYLNWELPGKTIQVQEKHHASMLWTLQRSKASHKWSRYQNGNHSFKCFQKNKIIKISKLLWKVQYSWECFQLLYNQSGMLYSITNSYYSVFEYFSEKVESINMIKVRLGMFTVVWKSDWQSGSSETLQIALLTS